MPVASQRPLRGARDGFVELAGQTRSTQRFVLNVGVSEGRASRRRRGHRLHRQFRGVPAHLYAMDQRGTAADGGGHVNRLGHLVEVGALLERVAV